MPNRCCASGVPEPLQPVAIRPPSPNRSAVPSCGDNDVPLVDPGRSMGLRLLALLGALSFLMLGVSSILPLLQPPSPVPQPRQAPVG